MRWQLLARAASGRGASRAIRLRDASHLAGHLGARSFRGSFSIFHLLSPAARFQAGRRPVPQFSKSFSSFSKPRGVYHTTHSRASELLLSPDFAELLKQKQFRQLQLRPPRTANCTEKLPRSELERWLIYRSCMQAACSASSAKIAGLAWTIAASSSFLHPPMLSDASKHENFGRQASWLLTSSSSSFRPGNPSSAGVK